MRFTILDLRFTVVSHLVEVEKIVHKEVPKRYYTNGKKFGKIEIPFKFAMQKIDNTIINEQSYQSKRKK